MVPQNAHTARIATADFANNAVADFFIVASKHKQSFIVLEAPSL